MPNQYLKWFFLITLSLLWGSSFILIKKSLLGLTPIQLGAVRVLITGIVLILFGFRKLKQLNKQQWFWVGLSGFIGTFFPSILFAYAETEIDSAIASILNSTVPLLALIVGLSFFGAAFIRKQFIGVFIALSWGFLDGEQFNMMQFGAGLIILLGVYLANKKKRLKNRA